MNFVRLVVFGFLALSVIYLAVSWYSRSVRREKLEEEWEQTKPENATDEMRSTFLAEGMQNYESGLRKKLILLIYVVPPIVVGTIIYFIN